MTRRSCTFYTALFSGRTLLPGLLSRPSHLCNNTRDSPQSAVFSIAIRHCSATALLSPPSACIPLRACFKAFCAFSLRRELCSPESLPLCGLFLTVCLALYRHLFLSGARGVGNHEGRRGPIYTSLRCVSASTNEEIYAFSIECIIHRLQATADKR